MRETRVLVAADFHGAWRASAWALGLREAGARVVKYDWSVEHSGGRLGYLERRALAGPGIARINRGLLRAAGDLAPDVVLVYAGRPVLPATVRALARDRVVAEFDNDDPFGMWGNKLYFRTFKRSLPAYSCHHVFREQNVSEYEQAGCRRVRVLRSFFLPWLHRPVDVSADDRLRLGADVLFVGNGQPGSRVAGVTALVEAGIGVRVLGDPRYWERHLAKRVLRVLPPIARVDGDEYAKAVVSSKICLAFFSDGNRDDYSVRSFEIPAMGAFMLAQRTPTMCSLYDEGSEAEFFGHPDELVEKVHRYLKDDDARERIARAGHERCLRSGYDVVARMREWLRDLRDWGLVSGGGA